MTFRMPEVFLFGIFALLVDFSNASAEITGKAILKLPPEQRISVVQAGVRERIARLSNFDVTMTREEVHVKLKGETIVERRPLVERDRFRWVRRNGSYKFEGIKTDLRVNKEWFQWRANYDEGTGVARSWSSQRGRDDLAAAIGYEEDRAPMQNPFAFYLTGKISGRTLAYIDSVLNDSVLKVTVEDMLGDGGEIIVRLESRKQIKNQEGHIRLWLQAEKGFSLKRFEERGRAINSGKTFLNRGDVTEEKQIDGIWFPMKVVQLIGHLSSAEGGETVMTVEDVKIGQVTDEDLALDFPDGTDVCDKIRQVGYIQGQESLSTVDFAGKDVYTSPRDLLRENLAQNPPSRNWYLWGNVLLVAVLAIALVLRQRRFATLG